VLESLAAQPTVLRGKRPRVARGEDRGPGLPRAFGLRTDRAPTSSLAFKMRAALAARDMRGWAFRHQIRNIEQARQTLRRIAKYVVRLQRTSDRAPALTSG